MKGTRTPVRDLAHGKHPRYVCTRCGIIRAYRATRGKPALCRDCTDVEELLQVPA